MIIKTRRSRDKVTFPYEQRGEPCIRCGYRSYEKSYYTITSTPVEVDDAVGAFALAQLPARVMEMVPEPDTLEDASDPVASSEDGS